MYRGGLNYMRYSVSDTAEDGDYTAGPRIVTEETKKEMQRILDEIKSGQYAKRWVAENEAGRPEFNATRARRAQPPDRAGRREAARDDAVPGRGRGDGRRRGEEGGGEAGRGRTMSATNGSRSSTPRCATASSRPGCSLHTAEKVRMALQLERLGVDVIEARLPDRLARRLRGRAGDLGGRQGRPRGRAVPREGEGHRGAGKALEPALHPVIHTFLATSGIHLQWKLKITPGRGAQAGGRGGRARPHASPTTSSSRPRTPRAPTTAS